jgi:hypothetical protein
MPQMLECPTCGHVFSEAAVEASVAPLVDLEPTLVSVGDVRTEVDPDLEPTAARGVGAVALEAFPDLEPTVGAAVKAPAEMMDGLEPTAVAEPDLPTEEADHVRCRYCGNEGQAEGLFCDRCGMRLPREAAVATASVAASPFEGRACRACGGRDFSEQGKCRDCGVQLSEET